MEEKYVDRREIDRQEILSTYFLPAKQDTRSSTGRTVTNPSSFPAIWARTTRSRRKKRPPNPKNTPRRKPRAHRAHTLAISRTGTWTPGKKSCVGRNFQQKKQVRPYQPPTAWPIWAPGRSLVGEFPAFVGQHQRGVIDRLRRHGLSNHGERVADFILFRPAGRVLSTKWYSTLVSGMPW